jgi:predicted ATPase
MGHRGGASPSPVTNDPSPHVLDILASLVDKSLVRPGAASDDEPRFEMLEIVRAYALERLLASDEAELIRGRFGDDSAAMAGRAGARRLGLAG